MNGSSDVERNPIGARILTIALLGGVALLLLPFVSGLIGAMILFVVASPALRHFQSKGAARRVAAFAIVLGLFVVFVGPGLWILVELIGQLSDAARTLQGSPLVQRAETLRLGGLDVGAYLRQAGNDLVAWSSRQTLAAISATLSATINLVIALFGAYYLLLSGDTLWERFLRLLPFRPAVAELLRVRFHRVTEAMLLGVALAGAAQGMLVGVAFSLVGFDHALFWGAVTAVVSILPMFGSALVWGPAVVLLAAQQRYGAASFIALLGFLLVSNIDNALRLVVYRRVSRIHPMVTLVGAFAGVRAFGLAGLLIGPLLISYGIELLKVYDADHRLALAQAEQRQGFPLDDATIAPTPLIVINR